MTVTRMFFSYSFSFGAGSDVGDENVAKSIIYQQVGKQCFDSVDNMAIEC